MAFSSGSRRSESGAQLLARLSTRPDIKGADPFIFGKSNSSSQVIELYASEGVGKTELALHCIAKICLPASWSGVPLGGLQAKVIYIDTESKFSILHLAVVLEKRIQTLINSRSELQSEQKDANIPSSTKIRHDMKSEMDIIESNNSKARLCHVDKQNLEKSNLQEKTDDIHTVNLQSNKLRCLKSNQKCDASQELVVDNSKTSSAFQILTPQDIEEIVQDSLGRIQILRAFDSQQLLASLLSLETILLEDPLYSLIVIDSISAFYWMDRLASPTSFQHLNSRMTPIAKVLKRFSSELGVVCLFTKSAYFGGKKSSDQDTSIGHATTFDENSYGEYLGNVWSSTWIKRIILTNIIKIRGGNEGANLNEVKQKQSKDFVKMIKAYCMSSETSKHYLFKDDLLVPVDLSV